MVWDVWFKLEVGDQIVPISESPRFEIDVVVINVSFQRETNVYF